MVRFGVADSDWFTVPLISCAGYLAPVPFGITVLCPFANVDMVNRDGGGVLPSLTTCASVDDLIGFSTG